MEAGPRHAQVEVLGVRHLVTADAARVLQIVRRGQVERCSEARLETDGRQRRSRAGRLLRVQPKCATAARKVIAAVRPIKGKGDSCCSSCASLCGSLVLQGSSVVEPDSDPLVVYDAGKHHWDDKK